MPPDKNEPTERRLFRSTVPSSVARELVRSESLSGAIVARARYEPDRIALESAERSLTYAALEMESTRLATALAAAGTRRGATVGLLLDRSIEAVVATIAIMLAGAACLPLDGAADAERFETIVTETGCEIAIGDPDAAARTEPLGMTLVDPGAADAAAPSLPPLESDDTAFVMYAAPAEDEPPRGVRIAHGDVLALLGATKALFDFGPGDRWALFHSCRSDVAVWELAACLTSGGTGIVVPAAVARDGTAIGEFLQRERVAVLHQTPSVFRTVAAAHGRVGWAWPALRWIVFSGEPIDRMTLRRFRGVHGSPGIGAGVLPRLANMYGVMEATVFSTFKAIEETELAGELASPLGFPLPHQEIALYDEAGAAVPAGTPGEMWIRGSGVAAGYLGEPALSAKRFVRRATPDGPSRYFRTGDVARRRPNGEFEYIGRIVPPRPPGT